MSKKASVSEANTKSQEQSGFTTLEMVVALAIAVALAIGFIKYFNTTNTSNSQAQKIDRGNIMAHYVEEKQMLNVSLSGAFPPAAVVQKFAETFAENLHQRLAANFDDPQYGVAIQPLACRNVSGATSCGVYPGVGQICSGTVGCNPYFSSAAAIAHANNVANGIKSTDIFWYFGLLDASGNVIKEVAEIVEGTIPYSDEANKQQTFAVAINFPPPSISPSATPSGSPSVPPSVSPSVTVQPTDTAQVTPTIEGSPTTVSSPTTVPSPQGSNTPVNTPLTTPPVDTPVPTTPPVDTPVPTTPPVDTAVPTTPPVDTAVPTTAPVNTPVPTTPPSDTPVPTTPPSDTVVPPDPTSTETPVPVNTVVTPDPTSTDTPVPVETSTPVAVDTLTGVPTETNTPEPTSTDVPAPGDTPASPSDTPGPMNTP